GRGDERDHPFILGVSSIGLPTYKAGYLAMIRQLSELGVADARGHLLFKISPEEYDEAGTWLAQAGVTEAVEASAREFKQAGGLIEDLLESVETSYLDAWLAEASLKSYPQAVADEIDFRDREGDTVDLTAAQWLAYANQTSLHAARARAKSMGVDVAW